MNSFKVWVITGLVLLPMALSVALPTMAKRPVRSTGGQRGVCTQKVPDPLTVFLPSSGDGRDLPSDVTGMERPKLYFYIPDRIEDLNNPVLRLTEVLDVKPEEGLIEPLELAMPKTSGVLMVEMPQALKAGKRYRWSLSLKCKRNTGTAIFRGIVTYKALDAKLAGKLTGSSQERAAIYAQEGLWMDSVATLMADRSLQDRPFDEILKVLGIDRPSEIMAEPEAKSVLSK